MAGKYGFLLRHLSRARAPQIQLAPPPMVFGPLSSTTPSNVKSEPISSDDAEAHNPPLLVIAAAMDDEFKRQMEIALWWLLIDRSLTTPSPPHNRSFQIKRRVKEEPTSPPCSRGIQIEYRMKEKSTSPPCSRGIQIEYRMKEKPTSPLRSQPVASIHRREGGVVLPQPS